MSRLNVAKGPATGLDYVLNTLKTNINNGGSSLVSHDHTAGLISMESLNDAQFNAVAATHGRLVADLQSIWDQAFAGQKQSFGIESLGSLTEAQKEAGAIVMGALGNPAEYARTAMTNLQPVGGKDVEVVGLNHSSFGIESFEPALEAFDEQELRNTLGWSVAFNVLGARQDEFSERFFPTVVLTPDQAGLDITIRQTYVLKELRHQLSGKTENWDKLNLIEAVIDHTILQSASNRIYPLVVSAGADLNTDKFVAAADVAPYTKVVEEGVTVLTAPLKFGVDINLLGLSQRNDIQTLGQLDNTDALDVSVRLETIYLKVVNTDGTSVIPFNVSKAPRNQWLKSVEGRGRELNLNYVTVDLPLRGITADVAGDPAEALEYLTDPTRENWVVSLAVKIGGNADVEFGTISAQAGNVEIVRIEAVNPTTKEATDITAANLAALKTALGALNFIGYDVYATRCNANLRTRGQMLNSRDWTERYVVNLGAPITIPSPVGTNREAADLATLINAVRIRNSNNAVTTILNQAEALADLNPVSRTASAPKPTVEGIARWVLRRPFFEGRQVNLLNAINSVKASDRARDVRETLVNLIRDVSYRMYRDSGYQAALDAYTGNSGEKPIVLVGTDPVTAKYLFVEGDTRTLGIGLESEVVVSQDKRLYGKILITLTRKGQNGEDPLSYGQFVWIPELAQTVQVSRNNATVKEVIVQPRGRHVINLPLLSVLELQNLEKIVTETTVYKTKEQP